MVRETTKMSTDPRVIATATAVPPIPLRRQEVEARALALFTSRAQDLLHLFPAYANAGIDTRYSCVPIEWYLKPSGWRERTRLYVSHALDLLEQVASECLETAGLSTDDVDALVVASTTGIATPSLDALLMERMGLRRDVMRLPVFGLGCAGGVLGLARAAAMARAHPGQRVLFLVVELCGLTFRINDLSKANIIATALFGDGAAGALLGSGDGPRLAAWGEHTWRNSLDVMGWRIEDDGFGVLFSSDIPRIVQSRFRSAVDGFLAKSGQGIGDVDGFICHPGGTKVIAALEEALGLAPETLAAERAVLREFGNMSAATVLFVLREAMRERRRGRQLMTGLGPGFTAGFLMLDMG